MDEIRIENNENFRENVFTKSVKAGKRTYYFDVKESKKGEHYVTVTERKRRYKTDGTFRVEKHKIFLYQEDFESFADALDDIIEFVRTGKKTETTEDDNFKISKNFLDEDEDENRDEMLDNLLDYSVDSFEDL